MSNAAGRNDGISYRGSSVITATPSARYRSADTTPDGKPICLCWGRRYLISLPALHTAAKQVEETDESYGARIANELEAAIVHAGPATVAAFIAEPVVGATIGAVAAVQDSSSCIRDICDRYDVLLILDEVMCGMGRTGTLHACEQEGIAPDLLLLAKGLGAGYQPIGAMMVSEKIYQAIASGTGSFNHGHTYMGHAVGCAAALAVQQVIKNEDLLNNVQSQGQVLENLLLERFGGHPRVGDIRGRGLLRAIEIVEDRRSKKPFASALKLHTRIKQQAMAEGLICYPGKDRGWRIRRSCVDRPALQRDNAANRGDCRETGIRARWHTAELAAQPVNTPELKSELGSLQLFTVGFGTIVGIAWVVLMGQILGQAGLVGVFIGLSIGALMMGLVGLCYAEVGTYFPIAGGEVAYVRQLYGVKTSHVLGWFLLLSCILKYAASKWSLKIGWIIGLLWPNIVHTRLYSVLSGSDVYLERHWP